MNWCKGDTELKLHWEDDDAIVGKLRSLRGRWIANPSLSRTRNAWDYAV